MKIACNIIARDAEQTISDCLNSILGLFYKIVIVIDTRSVDRTVEILSAYAQSYPEIELYFYEWLTQDWSKARNFALSKSKDADKIFWIDTDEYVEDRNCLEYLLRIQNNNAYKLKEASITDTGDMIEVDHIKIFPNVARWELPVHEQVIYSLEEKKIPIIPTNCRIIHTGYTDKETITKKHIRNYNSLIAGIKGTQNERKRSYLMAQKQKSDFYFAANNIQGINLGIDPVTISLIATVVSSLLKAGYSYYQSLETAKQQLAIQEALTESEKSQLAYSLFQTNPTIPYYMWYNSVDTTFSKANSSLPPLTDIQKNNNIWYYVAGALGLLLVWRLK